MALTDVSVPNFISRGSWEILMSSWKKRSLKWRDESWRMSGATSRIDGHPVLTTYFEPFLSQARPYLIAQRSMKRTSIFMSVLP